MRKSVKKKEREVFRFRFTLSLFLVVPPGIVRRGGQGHKDFQIPNFAFIKSRPFPDFKYFSWAIASLLVAKSTL